jgi:KipI family sensor histidine kinase inhibitor
VKVLPFGEGAWLVDLDVERESTRAERTLAAADAVRAALPNADVVVGAGALLVASAGHEPRPDARLVEGALASLADAPARDAAARPTHELPVVYDGPDLEELATRLGTSPAEVIRLHTSPTYLVELLGFLPGFGYLTGLDAALRVPRRPSPRPRVAPGSVGVAGEHSGVYPFASPGGWTLLGRSVGPRLFDASRDSPALLQPGDRVRFTPAQAGDAPASPAAPARPAEPPSSGICVVRAPPGTSVQDGGRVGRLHQGLPPSGPIDLDTHAAANLAVGNAPTAAALEVPFGAFSVRALGTLRVSVDGEAPRTLRDGETLEVPAHARAFRYLAVAGGFDVPLLLGARATLPVAQLGGFEGRFLRKGDTVPAGRAGDTASAGGDGAPEAQAGASGFEAHAPSPPDAAQPPVTLYVEPGPHRERFPAEAWPALLAGPWSLGRLVDRVGARLEGPALPREGSDLTLPCPMVRGAVQIARDGQPIVFGPDHPITGGYPVLAVVRRESLSLLGRLRPGQPLRLAAWPG